MVASLETRTRTLSDLAQVAQNYSREDITVNYDRMELVGDDDQLTGQKITQEELIYIRTLRTSLLAAGFVALAISDKWYGEGGAYGSGMAYRSDLRPANEQQPGDENKDIWTPLPVVLRLIAEGKLRPDTKRRPLAEKKRKIEQRLRELEEIRAYLREKGEIYVFVSPDWHWSKADQDVKVIVNSLRKYGFMTVPEIWDWIKESERAAQTRLSIA